MVLPDAPPASSPESVESKAESTLLLCSLSPTVGTQIEATLTAHNSTVMPVALTDIPEALTRVPDAQAIILYDTAVLSVMRGTQKQTAQDALSAWTDQAQNMLDVQTRNRRRIRLMDAQSVLVYADVFAARFNLSELSADKLATLPRLGIDPVLHALAQTCLQQDRRARQIAMTLESASMALSNSPPGAVNELETALKHYAQTRAHVNDLRGELEEHLLQESALVEARIEAEKRTEDAVAERETIARQIAALETDLAAARARAEDLEQVAQRNTELLTALD